MRDLNFRRLLLVVIIAALVLLPAFAGATSAFENSNLVALDVIVPSEATDAEIERQESYLSDEELALHAALGATSAGIVAASAPNSTSITMSGGRNVHANVNVPRWASGDGTRIFCLEQGRPFSNQGNTTHVNTGPIGNAVIRGILTLYETMTRQEIAAAVPGVSSLTQRDLEDAVQLALWNPGWGNGDTVSLSAENETSHASSPTVLAVARWLANTNNHPPASMLGTFYVFEHGQAGSARQRMIYSRGNVPAGPEAAFVKTIVGTRANLMYDVAEGVVSPVDGYVFYGPLSDARFTLHSGSSEDNARANALANAPATRIGTWNLQLGTLQQAINPCLTTGPDFSDWFTATSLDRLAATGITSWSDRVAFLSPDTMSSNDNLLPGWHAMSETQIPIGYHFRDDVTTVRFLRAGELASFTFNNVPITGHIHLQKTSSNPSITDGNDAYSLEGAIFAVYSMWGTRVGTLPPTDAQGRTNSYNMDLSFWANPLGGNPSGLPLGDYTLVEIVAPAGHVIDPTPIPVRLTSANMSDAPRPGNHTHPQYEYYAVANVEWENITTIPQQRPVLVVQKADSETGEPSAQGGATLEGAQFRVEFFGGFAPVENRDPARTWILRTGADGAARLDAEHLVSGDPFFIADGHVTLPLGTIRIQEIAAPTGYLINPEVFVRQITQESMGSEIAVYVPPVVDQQVARGDLELVKIAERTHERLEGVPFRITSYTTGESNIIVTDANGQASTAASWNTRIAETVNRGELATDGVWFGYRPAMSNAKGALPFDTYIIEELRAPSNEGFDLIEPFRVVISRDAVTINLGTLTNHPETESGVRISTQAHTGDRTTQTFRPGDEVDMHDEVRIEHIELEEGTPRAFRAWLFSRLDGEVSLVWASEYIEYTVENVIMSFTVNEVIDTSLFDPRTEFFYAETAYGQRDGEDGPEWERDYSHNFCGSDNRQTLWPDEDTPYTPQETDPAPEVESEEGSASEPSTSTAAGSARTPGLPRLGDVVDAWPLLLVFAGSMLFSMFAGYKFGVRVATPTLATAGASSKVTPADVKSDKPKSKPSKSVGKTDGKGSKKDDKADKDDKKDAKAKTAKPKDESDGKKEDESKDKSIKKKAKPSKKEDKSS